MFDKNKKILILCESPEKSKTITKIFRDAGYNKVVVMATIGHFDIIADGNGYHNTGIYPNESFKADFKIDPKKKEIVDKLKLQVKAADFIYVCSDPDREGEAIAWACVHFLKIPKAKYKRATYQAINKKAIFEAIENAVDIDYDLVDAAHARGCLDKLFGYRISQLLRSYNKGKSGGRCQSAALKMIVDREKEILNFKPEKYFDLFLHFSKNKVEFKAKYVGTDKKEVKKIKTDKEISAIFEECKGTPFYVKSIEYKDRKENPKPPFSTATFQQECSNKLGLTVKESADCAQKLFDAGKISYHRTDSEVFEEEFTSELKAFVKNNFDKKYVSGTVIKGKPDPDGQNGHEALHVLDLNLTPDLYDKEAPNLLLAKVYRIIYNRTVATGLKPAIVSQTTYNIYNKDHKFVMNSNELTFDGYKKIYAYKDDTEDKEGIVRETFSKDEELKKCSLESIPNETKPKARFKEASFVKELKDVGIGRPSTYASIIETIKSESRGYAVVENKCLKPTDKGMENIDFLDAHFSDIVNVEYTREMENSLDLIASGKVDKIKFLDDFLDKFESTCKKLTKEESDKVCPECGKQMVLRKGKFGIFYGCSGFPSCKHIESINKK